MRRFVDVYGRQSGRRADFQVPRDPTIFTRDISSAVKELSFTANPG